MARPNVDRRDRRVRIFFFDLPKLSSGVVLAGPLLVSDERGPAARLAGIVVLQRS